MPATRQSTATHSGRCVQTARLIAGLLQRAALLPRSGTSLARHPRGTDRGRRRAAGRLRRHRVRHRAAGAGRRRPAAAAGQRDRAAAGPAGAARGAGRARPGAVSQRPDARAATPPTACCAAWASTTPSRRLPAPRPRPRASCSTAARQDGAGAHRRATAGCRNWSPATPPRRSQQFSTHFTRLTVSRADGALRRAAPRLAPLRVAGPAGQRHDQQLAVRGHRRRAHARRDRHPDGRDVLGRHRLPPRAAQGRHLHA